MFLEVDGKRGYDSDWRHSDCMQTEINQKFRSCLFVRPQKQVWLVRKNSMHNEVTMKVGCLLATYPANVMQ